MLIEDAELDPEQETKLERELSRQYHILTRDDRLETVAKDIVRHFLGRGFVGKAMVVSIDKATALQDARQGAEVLGRQKRAAWRSEIGTPRPERSPRQARTAAAAHELLETTDMALIVSPGQNEIAQMQKLGLDIAPHRKRMNESSHRWTKNSRIRKTRCGWCSSAPCG